MRKSLHLRRVYQCKIFVDLKRGVKRDARSKQMPKKPYHNMMYKLYKSYNFVAYVISFQPEYIFSLNLHFYEMEIQA